MKALYHLSVGDNQWDGNAASIEVDESSDVVITLSGARPGSAHRVPSPVPANHGMLWQLRGLCVTFAGVLDVEEAEGSVTIRAREGWMRASYEGGGR